jgi:hypothetical protein
MKSALLACLMPLLPIAAFGDKATVVLKVQGCDYFLADGPRGNYLLEWYGGYDPSRGDTIIGEIGSYGFKTVFYLEKDREGRVYVEDYDLSKSDALGKLAEKCE